MKKTIFAALIAAALCSCTKETINYQNPQPGQNESNVTATLAVASRNTLFSSEDQLKGAIAFKSLGGKVVLDVNTNVDWSYEIKGDEFVHAEKDEESDRLILSCDENTVEKKLEATVTIKAGDKTATVTATQNAFGTVEIVASENNFHFAACGEITASFDVTSTDPDWTFESEACEWLLIRREGNRINISAYPNTEYADRNIRFVLIAGGTQSNVTEYIDVLQDRAAFITSSAETVPVTPTPRGSQDVDVNANFDWTYTVSGNDDGWLGIERTDKGFTFTPSVNHGESTRKVTITVTTGDGKENVATTVVTVSQAGIDLGAFIVGLNVAKVKNAIPASSVPVTEIEAVTIDWGDGSEPEEIAAGGKPSHTYTDEGYYVVSVKGSAAALSASSLSSEQRTQIDEVYNWGRLGLTSMESAFENCDSLKTVPADNSGAFENVTSFDKAFYNCKVLKEIPDGIFSKAVNAESFNMTFYSCKQLTEVPANLFYNCPKLTDATSLFMFCSSVTHIDEAFFSKNPELELCSGTFSYMDNLGNVGKDLFAGNPKITTFNSIFQGDLKMTEIPAGIFRNQPECESFRLAFKGSGITVIPEGLFANNKKCTSFDNTFANTMITSIPEDIFAGCSKIGTFLSCFNGCEKLTSVPANLFKNSGAQGTVYGKRGNGINMLFQNCKSLESIPEGLLDGFTKVTTLTSIFSGCSSLKSIPSGLFKDMAAVTGIGSAFSGCTSLKAVPEGVFEGLVKVSSFSGVFSGCTGITEVGANILAGCNKCTGIASMFQNCTSLSKVDENAFSFSGTANITSIADLFSGCTALKSVPENLFAGMTGLTGAKEVFMNSGLTSVPAGLFAHSAKITSFENAFKGCTSLTAVPDGLFAACAKVTSYKLAFQGCTSLETAGKAFGTNISKINLESIFDGCTSLRSIAEGIFDGLTGADSFVKAFYGCTSLENVPEKLFAKNINVTTASSCFQGCTALKAVPAGLFGTTTKTKTLTRMFSGCSSIETIAADAFSGINATAGSMQRIFENCTSLKEVPAGLFKHNAKISDYTYAFSGCTSLVTVGSEVFNCAYGAASLNSLFAGCTSLKNISEDMFISPEKVRYLNNMFQNCSSLESVPAGIFDNFKAVTSGLSTFNGCTALKGESPYTVIGGVKYHLYERTAENTAATGFAALANLASMFKGCTGLSDYANIPDACKE